MVVQLDLPLVATELTMQRTNIHHFILPIVLLLGACSADVVHPADRPHQSNQGVDWRDQVIYQIMVDRFENGDPNNDYNVEPSVPARYHGGDWQGIINKLDYLADLGVTTLWISPVVRNSGAPGV